MPYRAQARLTIGPAAIRGTVDDTAYLDRLQRGRAASSSVTATIQQTALQRKQEAAIRAADENAAKLAAAQAATQQRIEASRAKTADLQQQASTKRELILQQQNARLQRQQAKLGAAANYSNPNFSPTNDHLFPTGGAASKQAASIINEALKYRGRMYQWGGANPKTSFDCSGLAQWAYKSVGVGLPRVSADQARAGRKIPLQALRPGDLVAWDNSSRNQGADHIAIYIGNGQIIEAPRTGVAIRVRALGNEQNAWGVQILK